MIRVIIITCLFTFVGGYFLIIEAGYNRVELHGKTLELIPVAIAITVFAVIINAIFSDDGSFKHGATCLATILILACIWSFKSFAETPLGGAWCKWHYNGYVSTPSADMLHRLKRVPKQVCAFKFQQ
jgi:peptidoglycan/LPS O-acetylase OafA/YrhL